LIRVETGVFIPSDKAQETGELDATVYFEMKVHNRGKAIPPEVVKKIFDPFYTTKDYGTGIGLTLCKRIIENHRGSISVKSDDEGTVFTVWIPLKPPQTPNIPTFGT
jgi:signal transduction histidine kinase